MAPLMITWDDDVEIPFGDAMGVAAARSLFRKSTSYVGQISACGLWKEKEVKIEN